MERMLEGMVIFVAKIHNYILSLNDAYEKNFTDKQLHFLVIGILGMLILMVIYPLFKLLSENHILAIAFIYVFNEDPAGSSSAEEGRWHPEGYREPADPDPNTMLNSPSKASARSVYRSIIEGVVII